MNSNIVLGLLLAFFGVTKLFRPANAKYYKADHVIIGIIFIYIGLMIVGVSYDVVR